MNPNAASFTPTMKRDIVLTRNDQMDFLWNQIVDSKAEREQENIAIHSHYNRMQRTYKFLAEQTQRINRREPGAISREKVAEIMAEYKTLSAEYKVQTAKVSDMTAKIMTMEQRYSRLQMAASSSPSPTSTKIGGKKRKRSSLFSGTVSTKKMDGFQERRKYEMIMNSLPGITETVNDCLQWDEWCAREVDGQVKAHLDASDGMVKPTVSEGVDTKPLNVVYAETIESRESEQGNQSVEEEPVAIDPMMKNESPEPIITENEQIHFSSPSKSGSGCGIEHQIAMAYTVRSPNARSPSVSPEPFFEESDLEDLKEEMANILKMVTYGKTQHIQEALGKLLNAQYGSIDAMRIVIDHIIESAVSSNPRLTTLCARKFVAMCLTVQNHCESVCNNQIEWNWSDDASDETMNFDLITFLKRRILSTFCALQVGDDAQKFVNIMVLMAELYNERLLCSSTLVEVMESILCERHLNRVGKSDIDGLYEIFKRSSEGLRRSKSARDIDHYLRVLQRVRYQSVQFKIIKMHTLFYGWDCESS